VLRRVSGERLPARLSCHFWSAEIVICSRQPEHDAGRFHRYNHWYRLNRQNPTAVQISRNGDTPQKAVQALCRRALERLRRVSGERLPARLSCHFWSAEIVICSRQPEHDAGRFHRYNHWYRLNRQNPTAVQIPRNGDTPQKAVQAVCRRAQEGLRRAFACPLIVPFLECRDRNL
jgi:hypothetical protein